MILLSLGSVALGAITGFGVWANPIAATVDGAGLEFLLGAGR